MTEAWKPVREWEQYEVSSLGRVRRALKKGGYCYRKLQPQWHGYQLVFLSNGARRRMLAIHRLVGEAFLGPLLPGLETNHKNGDKADNRADNLEYVTRRENLAHARAMGRYCHGELHGSAKLSEQQVLEIRERAKTEKQKVLAAEFEMSTAQINSIVKGRTWKHLLEDPDA